VDIFRKDDGSTIKEGKRKIYATITPMKLVLPNGKEDGVLEKDDLIYVVKKVDKNDTENYAFTVLKFDDTDKEKTIYFGSPDFFKRYYDDQSSIIGEENKEQTKEKKNIIVPAIVGLGLGYVGYSIAKRFMLNAVLLGIGGIVLGSIAGHLISNKNGKD
jgi:lipopolysaccharide export LptBFGC system permease protein LptF